MPMETTVPTETVTKVIEVVEQMDYTEYLVKLVNSNELILDAVHVLSALALFAQLSFAFATFVINSFVFSFERRFDNVPD